MLRKVGESAWPISEKDAVVSIKDASYPIPFTQGLEFNSPAHGCWNIVHTGMLIPEAHQIYVCADNWMRSGADLQGTGATISRNQIFEMLYGSNYAKTWTNTGSKASKSNV